MVREYDTLNLPTVLRNFEKVLVEKDSSLIGTQLYAVLMGYCGFIAHYNIHGFRETYRDLRDLISNLLREDSMGLVWYINNKSSYLYDTKYRGRYIADFVKGILDLARKYRDSVDTYFAGVELMNKQLLAEQLADELGYELVRKGRKEVMPGKQAGK